MPLSARVRKYSSTPINASVATAITAMTSSVSTLRVDSTRSKTCSMKIDGASSARLTARLNSSTVRSGASSGVNGLGIIARRV